MYHTILQYYHNIAILYHIMRTVLRCTILLHPPGCPNHHGHAVVATEAPPTYPHHRPVVPARPPPPSVDCRIIRPARRNSKLCTIQYCNITIPYCNIVPYYVKSIAIYHIAASAGMPHPSRPRRRRYRSAADVSPPSSRRTGPSSAAIS